MAGARPWPPPSSPGLHLTRMPAYSRAMSNDMNRPANQHPAPQTSTDRPTATYPTDPAAIWADPAGYPTDWLADRTPTATYPAGYPQAAQAAQAAPHVTTNAPQNEGPIQDMGRPGPLSRPSMRWHPSLMQLAIGAAIALIALVGLQQYAVAGMADASRHCHELAVQDWARAERECRPAGSGTPAPGQAPSSPHTPSSTPSQAPSPSTPPALTRVTSPSPSTSDWVTQDTHAPYSRDDASASPLDLPRCTTAQDTPLPCLAHASSDGSRAVVLEEDGSMSGLVRR